MKGSTVAARSLVGVAMAALTWSAARAQQVELVPFRSVDDGVVIEVGKTSPRPSPVPVSEGEGISPDALAQDFAGLAPAPTSHGSSQVKRLCGRACSLFPSAQSYLFYLAGSAASRSNEPKQRACNSA